MYLPTMASSGAACADGRVPFDKLRERMGGLRERALGLRERVNRLSGLLAMLVGMGNPLAEPVEAGATA